MPRTQSSPSRSTAPTITLLDYPCAIHSPPQAHLTSHPISNAPHFPASISSLLSAFSPHLVHVLNLPFAGSRPRRMMSSAGETSCGVLGGVGGVARRRAGEERVVAMRVEAARRVEGIERVLSRS